MAAIKELPDPDPPEAQEEIGEGVPERVTALEAQVAELMKRVQDSPQPWVASQVTFLRFALYTRPIRPKTPQNKPPAHI